MTRRSRLPALAAAVGAGALVAVSLPPWGWWPLAFVGIAILDHLLADRPAWSRFGRGWLFGVAWMAPGMGWMWFLTAPGYVAASAVFAGYIGLACMVTPPGRWRRLALPAAITVAEAVRWIAPFGGVPLASLSIGQAAGPLAPTVRIVSALGLTWLTLVAGVGLSAAYDWVRRRRAADATAAVAGLGAVVVMLVAAAVAPSGTQIGTMRIAIVQGGGPQGTSEADMSPAEVRAVLDRHLAATRTIMGPVDVVVWPENVIDVAAFETSDARVLVAAEAARLAAPILVGVTEDAGPDHFTNAQIVVLPDGSLGDRYDKAHTVPFGEYMPWRGFLTALGAPTDLVARDAIPGTGPAVLETPDGRLGVAISWEIFFTDRAREAARDGGAVLLNPTNGSSYTGTVLQTQQIASSRLRALETGRWVVQVAPTGFSAFVTPDGEVLDRTGISETAVREQVVGRRDGRTIAVRIGEWPIRLAAVAVLALAIVLAARRRSPAASGQVEEDGGRAVVHEGHVHEGTEATGGHGGA